MKSVLAAAAALLLVLPSAAVGREAVPTKGLPATVLALDGNRRTDFLQRVRGDSLTRVSKRRLALHGRASSWAFSPDRSRLAIVTESAKLAIVDTRRLRIVRFARTPGTEISNLAWVPGGRIIALDNRGAFVVDAWTGRLLRATDLPGSPFAVRRAGRSIAAVLGPRAGVGTAILATVDADGVVRTVGLDRIKTGSSYPSDGAVGESWIPGLALDSDGRRALVVGPAEIAEVDLDTMSATYWRPVTSRSLLLRLHDWLEPAAEAKGPMAGSFRSARTVDGGRIAVTGWDARPDAGGGVDAAAAGLTIVDVNDHSAATLDGRATDVRTVDGMLLATASWPVERPLGLVAFSSEGSRRYELFAGQDVGVWEVLGPRAFVHVPKARRHIHVLDAFHGRVLSTRYETPRLLDRDWMDY